MVIEQILNLEREDILAAGYDHVVVAFVDESQAVLVEVAGVAGRQQTVDDLFVSAVGVTGEAQTAGDKNGSDATWFGDLAAILVVDGHRATNGWAPDGAGRAPQFVWGSDGGDRNLGGPVQVVQHGAERIVGAATKAGRQRRPRGEEHFQR